MGDTPLDNFFDTDSTNPMSGMDTDADPMLSSTLLSTDLRTVYASDDASNRSSGPPAPSTAAGIVPQGGVQQQQQQQQPATASAGQQQRQLTVPHQLYIANLNSSPQQQQSYVLTPVGATVPSNQVTAPLRIVRLPGTQSTTNQSVMHILTATQGNAPRVASLQSVRLHSSSAPVSAVLGTSQPSDASAGTSAQMQSQAGSQQTRMVYLPASFASSAAGQVPIVARTLAPAVQSTAGNVVLQGGKTIVTLPAGSVASGMTLVVPCAVASSGTSTLAAVASGSSPAAAVSSPPVCPKSTAEGLQQPCDSSAAAATQTEIDAVQRQLKQLTSGSGRKSQAIQQQIAETQEKLQKLKAQQQAQGSSAAAIAAAAAAAAAASVTPPVGGRRGRRGAAAAQISSPGAAADSASTEASTTVATATPNATSQLQDSGQLLAAAAKDVRAQQAREKSIQIAQKAIEKARAAGVKSVPGFTVPSVAPAVIPSTVDTVSFATSVNISDNKKTPAKKVAASKTKAKVVAVSGGRGKRKRKQPDSSDMSDLDLSPPQSPASQEDVTAKRRSGRVTKRTKYVDELELDITDDDKDDDQDETGGSIPCQDQDLAETGATESDTIIVEKILGMRKAKLGGTTGRKDQSGFHHLDTSSTAIQQPVLNAEENESDEYFVKYKNYSFLHCEWKTAAELEKGDKRIRSKIKRFRIKRVQQNSFFAEPDEDELFNPEYTEVERVLSESRTPDPDDPSKEVVHYLIKWRQLPYEDSTWELEQDVTRSKIEEFRKICQLPTHKQESRPKASAWAKVDPGREYHNDNTLRPYQHEGVNWLTFCYYKGQNCILADEMGLGKTIQSIAFLQEVFDYGIHGPFLVVAPLSTIANWLREFEQWTEMNTIVYHGSAASRGMLQEYEMYYKDKQGYRLPDVYKFHAMITTYEVIIQDVEILSDIQWHCCIIDEAHRLKNKHSKLLEGLRCFQLEHKVLLSGTPLQNNVQELFSLLNFLEPDRFHSAELFLTEFGDLKTEAQVERLKAILKPMMLRRLKEDVEKNLAPKEETIIEVELTAVQKQYYRAILEKNFTFLKKTHASSLPSLMNTMMELRKCCNHPYLVNGAEERILEEERERCATVATASDTLPSGQLPTLDAEHLLNVMVQASGKLVLLDKLLPKLKAGNHKVLIFSQMIRVLDILEDYLIQRKYCYERLDGRIRGNLRQEAIDRFSKPDTDRFVFLLCTRAGGLGINLTAADTCIIYDSDWNPQNDLQAQARCHRIGQEKAVKVYRLICRKTYEREMFDRASKKLGLDKAVLQSMSAKENATQAPLTKKEVEDLLKRGAYGALMDDDRAGDQFCEEDIDLILQRRTQVITIDSVGKGSTFAKASFSSSGTVDIDINDPEFWQKWAKRAELDTEKAKRKNELVIEEPRQRKQTARYGNQNAMMEELPSELESSTESEPDEKLLRTSSGTRRGGRRGRRRADDDSDTDALPPPGAFTRPECFKVEKHLLVYGWGRWHDIVEHAKFKRELSEEDVETIARAMLHYSLKHYKGDERIKAFIWDLITPSEDGSTKNIKNHSGLAAPVPRGRKRRLDKKDPSAATVMSVDEKIIKCDHVPEAILVDSGYRKHLTRHANRLLLRVRLLYYLKQEILGDQASKVFEGVPVSQLDMVPPPPMDGELPVSWWDEEADRCLLVGIYKHGYEKYNAVRGDPDLCFLGKCGPPDGQALAQEQAAAEDDGPGVDDDDNDKSLKLDDDDDDATSVQSKRSSAPCGDATPSASCSTLVNGKLPFPSTSDLNTRLRRLITSYQRNNKRRQDQHEKQQLRWERSRAAIRSRDLERLEKMSRWTRKEESDFHRILLSFGVERDRQTGRYLWDTFRRLGNLGKKDDNQLTEYYQAFYRMCQRVSGRLPSNDEDPATATIAESLSENQAARCLARVDLLSRIREGILWHPRLTERLRLCQPSAEMPSWWQCGEHDKDLLIGAAKHGLAHTNYHIQNDRKLCFHSVIENLMHRAMKPDDAPPPTSSSTDVATHVASDDAHDATSENGPPAKSSAHNGAGIDGSTSADVKDEAEIDVGGPRFASEQISGEELSAAVKENGFESKIEADTEKMSVTVDADKQNDALLIGHSAGLVSQFPANQHLILPNVHWPRDRVIIQRLDQICHCIEHGEWPSLASSRKLAGFGLDNVGADSPSGTPEPFVKSGAHVEEYNIVDNDEGNGLKMTLSKQRQRKPQHYHRIDVEAERIAKLREGTDSIASSPIGGSGANAMDGEDYGDYKPLIKKRGKKLKTETTFTSAASDLGGLPCDSEATATAAGVASSESMQSLHRPPQSELNLDAAVSVVNLEDGSRLSGDEAPRLRDLDRWLQEHPGYTVDSPHHEGVVVRQRRRRVDPDLLNLNALTGDENVSVINRETGKKITGVKAPQLKHLAAWLEKNTNFDVDRKWAALVRAKGNLPDELLPRVPSPVEKRIKKPRASSSATLASGDVATVGRNAMMPATPASLMASLQDSMRLAAAAYGNLAAIGMPSQASMLGLYGMNVPSPSAASGNDESDLPAEGSSGNGVGGNAAAASMAAAAAAAAAAASTHSAFSLYGAHPLAYASMLAGMGLTSQASASSFAAAAAAAGYPHPAVLNGLMSGMLAGTGASATDESGSVGGGSSSSVAGTDSRDRSTALRRTAAVATATDAAGGKTWPKGQRPKEKKTGAATSSASDVQQSVVGKRPKGGMPGPGAVWQQQQGGHDYAEMPQDLSIKRSSAVSATPAASDDSPQPSSSQNRKSAANADVGDVPAAAHTSAASTAAAARDSSSTPDASDPDIESNENGKDADEAGGSSAEENVCLLTVPLSTARTDVTQADKVV